MEKSNSWGNHLNFNLNLKKQKHNSWGNQIRGEITSTSISTSTSKKQKHNSWKNQIRGEITSTSTSTSKNKNIIRGEIKFVGKIIRGKIPYYLFKILFFNSQPAIRNSQQFRKQYLWLNQIQTKYPFRMQRLPFIIGFFCFIGAYPTRAQCPVPFEIGLVHTTVNLDCGDTVQLRVTAPETDSSLQIAWTTTIGNILSGEQTVAPIINALGAYEVTISTTIGQEVCIDKKQILVESRNREPLNITFPNSINCNQPETMLAAVDDVDQSAYNYEWTTTIGSIVSDANQPTITVNSGGVYNLQRTDVLGNCPTLLSVVVFEERITSFKFDFLPPDCEQTAAIFAFKDVRGGSGAYLYSIDGGITFQEAPEFNLPLSGNYNLVVKDAGNDCQLTIDTTFSFMPILQQLNLPAEVSLKKDATYQLPLSTNLPDSLIANIQWSPATGLSCTDCLNPTLTATTNQTYEVIVTDKNGCEAQANINLLIAKSTDFYMPNVFSPNGDGRNDRFTIFVNPQKISRIQQLLIFDRYGSLIFERTDFLPNYMALGWDGRFKGEEMPSGSYAFFVVLERVDGGVFWERGGVDLVR